MNSKQKGKRGELEWASYCRGQGYDCRRTAQYCGNTGDASDVVGLPGIHQEVKRVERLDWRRPWPRQSMMRLLGNIPL